MRADAGQRPLGLGLHRRFPQEADPGNAVDQLAAHEEVADHVSVRAERQVLVDRLDAERLGVAWAAEVDRLAGEDQLPGAWLERPGQDLDQGRLAGAVVAEQRHHLARMDLEADPVEGGDRAEALADAIRPEQRLGLGYS